MDHQRLSHYDDVRRKGFLLLDADGNWTFIQRDPAGRIIYRHDLNDLPTTWRNRILDGSLQLGWQKRVRAYHVSAKRTAQGGSKLI
jgi:hypothetical protein